MIRRYSYLRAEGFTLPEAVEIVNRETGYSHVRLLAVPTSHPAGSGRSERSTAPLVRRLVVRVCLIVTICGGMWAYGQVAEAACVPPDAMVCQALDCPPRCESTTTIPPTTLPVAPTPIPPFTG